MALLILAFIISLAAVSAASRPVSVHYGEDATFSWPLPASARGVVVRVVNPYGVPVLDWSPDCTVTPSSSYTHRIRSSCNDASRVTFTLRGVTWPDEGSYTCTSLSDDWIPDCGQNLTLVKVPPKVHIELSTPDTVAMDTKGKYLTLTCVVTEAAPSVPEDGYSWSYLPSSHGQLRPLVGKTSTLTLGPLTRENSGQYFCQASNDQHNRWNILSGMASYALNSSCIDAFLHADISPQAVVEKDRDGYKAVFQLPQQQGLILVQHPNTYIITDWHPPCNFSVTEAFKQRVTNMSCDPCQGTLSFSLVNVTTKDLGWYQCYAGTIHGTKINSCSVEIISKVPIQVHIKPVTPGAVVKAAEGDHLTLTCVVTEALPSVPEDGYSWSYLSSPQGRLRSLVGKTNTLSLCPLTREASGQYFCQARNDLTSEGKILPGNASVTVDVSYLSPIKSLSDLKVNKGDHVTLTCTVDSKPTARLAWVVEGQEVRHVTANEDHYVISSATCSDSKTYRCRASNPDLPGLERTTSTILSVSCGQVQASDGHERLLITLVVLVVFMVVMLAVTIGVLIYYIRRKGRDRPDGVKVESQQATMVQTTSPAQETSADRAEQSPEPVRGLQNLHVEEELHPLIDLEDMEPPMSPSQGFNTDMTTRAEQSTSTVHRDANLDNNEETVPLTVFTAREVAKTPSQVSNADANARADEPLDAAGLGANLDDEETNLTVDLKAREVAKTPSQGSNADANARADEPLDAAGLGANLDDEETNLTVDLNAREVAKTPSLGSNADANARADEPPEAAGLGANLDDAEKTDRTVDLKTREVAKTPSQVSNADNNTRADEPLEAAGLGANLDDAEKTDPAVDLKNSKGSMTRPQVSTSDTTQRAETSSGIDQTDTTPDGECGPLFEDSKGSLKRPQESTTDMIPRAERPSKVDQALTTPKDGDREPLLGGNEDTV